MTHSSEKPFVTLTDLLRNGSINHATYDHTAWRATLSILHKNGYTYDLSAWGDEDGIEDDLEPFIRDNAKGAAPVMIEWRAFDHTPRMVLSNAAPTMRDALEGCIARMAAAQPLVDDPAFAVALADARAALPKQS